MVVESPLSLIAGGGLIAYSLMVRHRGRSATSESMPWQGIFGFGLLMIYLGW